MDKNIVLKIKEILYNDPEVKERWEDLVSITSFVDFLKSFKLIYFFIKKLVYVIEFIEAELGKMSKEERIEYAAVVLDDLIVFSGWAAFIELIDGFIFKIAISQVVAALDDKFGNGSWFNNSIASSDIDPSGCLKGISTSLLTA